MNRAGRFFYHSFPRRKGQDTPVTLEKGIKILSSLETSGLLLTPEKVVWDGEVRIDGARENPVLNFQRRACFTELDSSELKNHAETFGPFAIEFSIADLRALGAIPVFYLPKPPEISAGLEGVSSVIVARLAQVQSALTRLADLTRAVRSQPNKAAVLHIVENGQESLSRATIGGAEDIADFLVKGLRPADELAGVIKGIGNLFYPTENLKHASELLRYYRQREWRIFSGGMHNGVRICRQPSEAEKEFLITLDPDFFAKQIDTPTGETQRRVDGCEYFGGLAGRPFLRWARRVIAPEAALIRTQQIVKAAGLPAVALESLS